WGTYALKILSEAPFEFQLDTAYLSPEKTFEMLAREYPTTEFDCLLGEHSLGSAGRGSFNPQGGRAPWAPCEPDDALYEQVFGRLPQREPTFVPLPEPVRSAEHTSA